MKLFICNKAGECSDANCESAIAHEKDYCCTIKCRLIIGSQCVKYRYPLEAAILRDIAAYRLAQRQATKHGSSWFRYDETIYALWKVFKAGRKANNEKV